MFGESESESPRVPSPWDSLMSASTSVSPSPIPRSRALTPSPLGTEFAVIPRLVPESDDGNVEYKLQLLNPTPARFARLVTQLKWRLLEGGGQAYYELGVADSGDLIGLPRADLERTLETLEMMAGEIGASVIVVKEIEIPIALSRIAKRNSDTRRTPNGEEEDYSSSALSSLSNSDVDLTDEGDDLSSTVVLDRDGPGLSGPVFSMDPDSDPECANLGPRFYVDLEISSVFKPRPVRTKRHTPLTVGGKNKRTKKTKNIPSAEVEGENASSPADSKLLKAQNKRLTRDRKREEKKDMLMARAAQSISVPVPVPALDGESIISALEDLQLSEADKDSPASKPIDTVGAAASTSSVVDCSVPSITIVDDAHVLAEDEDDVFPSTAKRNQPYPHFPSATSAESHLDVDPTAVKLAGTLGSDAGSGSPSDEEEPRLIVEALVVRKMSLDEAYLDFGGFSVI